VHTSDARARDRGRRPRIDRRREHDDGSSTLEYAILVPVVLLLLFTCIQVSLYSFARSVALTAAQEGANAQRAYGALPGAGEKKADDIINAQGDVLQGWHVSVTTSGGEVVVTVTGSSLSLFPGVDGYSISQTSSGPIEVFHQ
jgi:Flp pilus assembly protein TadG